MDRGWYAGPVGWMDAAEDGEFCVALRSAVHHYFFGQTGRASTERTDALFRAFGGHAGAAAFYTLGRWAIEREG